MQVVEKSVLVAHTPAQMFALVDDIEHYSRFLPWCGKTEVLSREGDQVVASLHIDYLKVKQHFTTRNTNQPGESILMELVDGPFEQLEGRWRLQTPRRDRLQGRVSPQLSVFQQDTGNGHRAGVRSYFRHPGGCLHQGGRQGLWR